MEQETLLRDRLAVDRTALANERTLLAYLRTGMGFVAAGASAIHFLGGTATLVTGWILIALGVVLTIFGAFRFTSVRKRLSAL